METILIQAQTLVYTLLGLMPTSYQRDSLQAMLGLFLEAQGHPLPQHSQTKSPSALSRFLNQYDWGTRQIIRAVRKAILKELLGYAPTAIPNSKLDSSENLTPRGLYNS